MPYLAVLGVGVWSPTRGVRFKPGVYEVDDEIARLAREAGTKKLLVSEDTPFVISTNDDDVYLKPKPRGTSLRPEPRGDPDAAENLADPEKEDPSLSYALTLEDLQHGMERGVRLEPHLEMPAEPEPVADTEPPVLPTGVRYACEFCDEEKASGASLARHIEFHHAVTR